MYSTRHNIFIIKKLWFRLVNSPHNAPGFPLAIIILNIGIYADRIVSRWSRTGARVLVMIATLAGCLEQTHPQEIP